MADRWLRIRAHGLVCNMVLLIFVFIQEEVQAMLEAEDEEERKQEGEEIEEPEYVDSDWVDTEDEEVDQEEEDDDEEEEEEGEEDEEEDENEEAYFFQPELEQAYKEAKADYEQEKIREQQYEQMLDEEADDDGGVMIHADSLQQGLLLLRDEVRAGKADWWPLLPGFRVGGI